MRFKRELKWGLMLCAVIGCTGHLFAADAAAPTSTLPPEGLALASSDPAMVIAISNLRNVSQKFSKLNDMSALALPPLNDLSGQIRGALKAPKSIRDDGPISIVVPSGAMGAQSGGFDWAAIPKIFAVTTTDYAALVSSLGGDSGMTGVTSVKPAGDRPGFAKSYPGGIAAFSGKQDLLDSYSPLAGAATSLMTSAGTAGARTLSSADIAIYINMQQMGPAIAKTLQASLDETDKALDSAAKSGEPASYVMKRAWNRMYGDALKAFIRDTAVLSIGIELTDQGVLINAVAQFKPGSFMATATNGNGDVTGLMSKFPLDPITMAFVTNTKSLGLKQSFEEAAAKYGPTEKGLAENKLLKKAAVVMDRARSVGHVTYAPQQGNASEPSLWLFEANDPKAFVAAFKEFVLEFPDYQPALALPPALGGTAGPPGKSAFKAGSNYSSNVLAIDGSPVDQYELTFAAPEGFVKGLPPRMQPFFAEMNTGRTGFLATFNNLVLVTTSPDAQIIRQALIAAKQSSGLGADRLITESRPLHYVKPGFEAYFSVSAVSSFFAEMSRRTGVQPIATPLDLPLLSVSGVTEGGSLSARLLLTHKVIEFVSGQRDWYLALLGQTNPTAAPKRPPLKSLPPTAPSAAPAANRPAAAPTPTPAPSAPAPAPDAPAPAYGPPEHDPSNPANRAPAQGPPAGGG